VSLGQFNDALQNEEDAPRDEDAIGAFPRCPLRMSRMGFDRVHGEEGCVDSWQRRRYSH
jgi:hypothetical protein